MLKRLVSLQHKKENYCCTVVSLREVGPIGQQLREAGIEVIALEIKSIHQLVSGFFRLWGIIRDKQPDIVQTWMYHADLIGGLAARLAGCSKIIWGIRNTDTFYNKGVSRATVFIVNACALLSRFVPHTIVCVAYKGMDAHIAKGYAGRKMMVIGNGFDTQRFKSDLISRNETRQQLGLSKDSLVIGSIGRFNEYKDHRSLIRSAGEIASKNSKAFFLLAGRDVDSGNSSVMGWVDETGYSDRFFLLGERSDIGALLNAMDVFCLHSISEGFPNVLGEAMSVGLPAVVSDVGDAALVLGDAGVVVPPRDESELTKGLLKLINSSVENRVLLGKAARMRIEERYSMDSIQHQYDELYQRVLST